MRTNYFVTAIGTGCGKTVVSATLCKALEADYWKPVQAGRPTDTEWIRKIISTTCHKERFLLNMPASPHYAAEVDGVEISLDDFSLPVTKNTLVIEGAGGILVPLNEKNKVIDLAPLFSARIVLVCNIYLGSINHSLLSIEYLKQRGFDVAGLIFNGPATPSTESIIEAHSPWPVLLKIRPEDPLDTNIIDHYATLLARQMNNPDKQI